MKFLQKLLGKGNAPPPEPVPLPDTGPDAEPALSDAEIDAVFARAEEELRLKTEAAAAWGMGSFDHWDADLETGILTFTGAEVTATAPLQVIGTFNEQDASWLWGWDHPSVPEPLAAHAALARDFGARNGLEMLTTRKVAIQEEDAWAFTALACHLAGAQGGYRAPVGPTLVFMTFGDVTLRKA